MLKLPKISIALVLIWSLCQIGCDKPSDPALPPSNQTLGFNMQFGQVSSQGFADIKRTADGGYIVLGATNAAAATGRRDMLLVKVNAQGTQDWMKTFGAAASTPYTYDEEGVKIVVTSTGYVIAGNKTYYNGTIKEKTKIVLYEVDLMGNTTNGPVVLRNTGRDTSYTEMISDIKKDGSDYVLVGSTTNVFSGKPGGPYTTDGTDMLAMKLNANFASTWASGAWAYGFAGEDKAIGVEVLPDGYVIAGIDQQSKNNLENAFRLSKYRKINGAIISTKEIATTGLMIDGGYTCYDSVNQKISILGEVTSGTGAGDLVLVQTDEDFLNPTINNYGNFTGNIPATQIAGVGVNGVMTAGGIAVIPDNKGYIISYTSQRASVNTDVGLIRLENTLAVATDFPYVLSSQGLTAKAGAVIPVIDASTSSATGYAFTGAFGVPNQLGIVKIDDAAL